jgi:UPF0716 family protein affecting phage T7 exclusion
MSLLADSVIDWGALFDVIWISAVAGLGIAAVLGVGIVSSLRAQDNEGATALGLNAVTVVAVVLVAAALITGIYFITDK